MARRNANTHVLKERAHPHRVALPIPADGWGAQRGRIQEAAQRLSGGQVYWWYPSRIYPPVTMFGFQTVAARDAFARWATDNDLKPTTTGAR